MVIAHIDQSSFEGVLQSLMAPFYHAISRRVIGGGEFHLNIKGFHDILEEVGYKSIAVVGNCRFADTKPRHPLHEGFGTLGGRGLGHGIGLKPPGGPIQDRQQVPGALRLHQGSYHVQVNGGEPLIRYVKITYTRVYCFCLFPKLTWMTSPAEVLHIALHAGPVVVLSYPAQGLFRRWMVLMMD